MILVVGEILMDIFPDHARIGGAPFNFAYHLKKLGFDVRFLTRVGQDDHGRRILDRLAQAGFDLADVQFDDRHPTGSVQVSLDGQGVPRFDIRVPVAYDFLQLDPTLAGAEEDRPEMIYFGSLVQRSDAGRRQVQGLLANKRPPTLGFCDINLRPPHVNALALQASLAHADILKLNEDELVALGPHDHGPDDTEEGIGRLKKTYGITAVALTRGDAGSSFFGPNGRMDQPVGALGRVVDTVGAGDGFAAILAAGQLRQRPINQTLLQASQFAARICGIPGAVPDDDQFYNDVRRWIKGCDNAC